MVTVTTLKFLAIGGLFLVGFLGGLLPAKIVGNLGDFERWVGLGNTFAAGVFLSAGLCHMLREAASSLYEHYHASGGGDSGLMVTTVLCLVGFFIGIFIDTVLKPDHHHGTGGSGHPPSPKSGISFASVFSPHPKKAEGGTPRKDTKWYQCIPQPDSWNPYILMALLSTHSIIEGMAVGVETTFASTMAVLAAIFPHKVFEGMAIAMNLLRSGMTNATIMQLLGIFAISSPVGVLIGMYVPNVTRDSAFTGGVLKAIASGTFLYIAIVEMIVPEMIIPSNESSGGNNEDGAAGPQPMFSPLTPSSSAYLHPNKTHSDRIIKFFVLATAASLMAAIEAFFDTD